MDDIDTIHGSWDLLAGFDFKFINELDVTAFGSKLLDRLGADVTNYGIVSGRNRSLFVIVPYDKPAYEICQNNEQIGGMEM